MKKQTLWLELIIIYIFPPLLFISGVLPLVAIMPVLWFFTLYAFILLKGSEVRIFALDFSKKDLLSVLQRFALIASAMTGLVLVYTSESFLSMPRTRPWFWLGLLFLYPIFSAFMQEILFRAFFFKRYKRLFPHNPLYITLFNALVFSYIHIIFLNWIAILFTFIGGLLFAQTYLKTRSTLLVSIEHALYGNALYTIGLGSYFYHG
jgi:membrane protease YdiL (CAAX protease family)